MLWLDARPFMSLNMESQFGPTTSRPNGTRKVDKGKQMVLQSVLWRHIGPWVGLLESLQWVGEWRKSFLTSERGVNFAFWFWFSIFFSN